MSDLVGNPEDRFSRVEAPFIPDNKDFQNPLSNEALSLEAVLFVLFKHTFAL